MTWLSNLIGFLRNLSRAPSRPLGTVEDSAEMVMETERRRGMRGL